MSLIAVKTRLAPGLTGLLNLGNMRAALTADTHSPEMDKLWRLPGEERVRCRFTAAAAVCKA
jgi:glutamyl/glutaminyl-tRNA synthetase